MLQELLTRYPQLTPCAADLQQAVSLLVECYRQGGKLLLCGNGGSCADCDHIVGELTKGFLKHRPLPQQTKAALLTHSPLLTQEVVDKLQGGLPALSLPSMTALGSAFGNDVDPQLAFAQAVLALGKPGDTLLAISTSGNAANVFAAATVAKGLGLTVIALTGESGGKLAQVADVCLRAPETETFKVQELHLPVYHYLCATIEQTFFEE